MRNKKKHSKNKDGLFMIIIGLLLVLVALFIVGYNLYDDFRAEQEAIQAAISLEEYLFSKNSDSLTDENATPDYVLFPDMEMPIKTVNGTDYIGILKIPSLELELPIISEWNYSNLKTAPCRYSGSAYLNNLIICGHNYTAHLGRIRRLSEGDIATFTDIDGNVFTYKAVEQETLLPTAVEDMESGDWDLTLFTCTLGGRTRVTVRFELKED